MIIILHYNYNHNFYNQYSFFSLTLFINAVYYYHIIVASKLYGVNATIIIFLFVLYFIVLYCCVVFLLFLFFSVLVLII